MQTLSTIDAAASQGDLAAVMNFYSPAFTSSDGLTYASLEAALTALWEAYPDLTYQTQLNSWRQEGDAIIAETTTTITGAKPSDRNLKLDATLTSRQRFENNQIVSQEILTERSQISLGDNPPTIEVRLPTEVTAGEEFAFDAIVTEPLGDRLLLGTALEEPIDSNGYLNPTPIELELLSAGGLFKVGQAPVLPDSRWISAVIVREDGITAVTQRLRVVQRGAANPGS